MERKRKQNREICGVESLDKSETKVEDKGESEEAAVGIESDGRRKEIADKQ